MKIGITGGIGSGKSYVCRHLQACGYEVFDCDSAAKRLMRESDEVRQQLTELLGPDTYAVDGSLNKAVVAQFLLSSKKNAKAIDRIVHPQGMILNYFSAVLGAGSYYEIKDIKALNGYSYYGIASGSTMGTASGNASVRLIFNSAANNVPNPGYSGNSTDVSIMSSGKLTTWAGAAQHAQPKLPAFSGRVVVTSDKTPLRSAASSSASKLATLGEETGYEYIEYTKDSNGSVWYKVKYEDMTGWLPASRSSFRGNASNHTAGEQLVVVDGNEWIHEGPNLSTKSLEVAYGASKCEFDGDGAIDERGIEWYKVKYKKTTAWISSRYAMFVSEYSGAL